MRRGGFVFWLVLTLCFFQNIAFSQNTSNKGKEFWIAYTGHIDGTESKMYLYLTSDVSTTASVRIGGVDIPGSPFAIMANTVTPVAIDPTVLNVYIGSSDIVEKGKAIHVTSEKPIVVYSHIFRSARSAATLVLPVKVLGREYYASAYVQNISNANNQRYSEFTIIGVEDNTTVEITPKHTDIGGGHPAGQAFQIKLNKGDIYQYQSQTDLSGSHILSVAGDGSCKPIAVFSGSTWLGFCENAQSGSGGDNLYQQLYPITSWGKQFITAPFINRPYDIVRIYFSKSNTSCIVNGNTIPGNYSPGNFYEFVSRGPNQISASEPISVVQYQVSQNCDPRNPNGNNNNPPFPGDPEMTILNPVEQTLSKITVYSALRDQTSPPTNITQHYINVIIKDEFKPSFRINGLLPRSAFTSIPGTGHSYLQEDVTAISNSNPTHTLSADGGFSAIAYGYGNLESYGYLAGADARNLYKNLQISNTLNQEEIADVCVGTTTDFTLVIPYRALSVVWEIDGVPETRIPNPTYFATEVIDGIQVYKYKYKNSIPFNAPGVHTIRAEFENPNPSGCEINEEILLEFEVFELPVAAFSASTLKSCENQQITFTDKSVAKGKSITKWIWDFGDGSPVVNEQNPIHTFTSANSYRVKLSIIAGDGCTSEFIQDVRVLPVPLVVFDALPAMCITDQSIMFQQAKETKGNVRGKGTYSGPGIVTAAGLFDPLIAGAGNHLITYTYKSDEGCEDIKTQTILVTPEPEIIVPTDLFILEGGELRLNLADKALNSIYTWEGADAYLSDPNILNPVIQAGQDERAYTLKVVTEGNCIAEYPINIHIMRGLKPSNAFSPNGDGVNDQWIIKYIETYPDVTVQIFNRHGERVFFTNKYHEQPFDGQHHNKALPVGTYYYIIDPKNGRPRLTGSLTIIR